MAVKLLCLQDEKKDMHRGSNQEKMTMRQQKASGDHRLSRKSFDCPCHGSRFTKEGVVINGPATVGLEKIRIKE